jgi:hypothetical protein
MPNVGLRFSITTSPPIVLALGSATALASIRLVKPRQGRVPTRIILGGFTQPNARITSARRLVVAGVWRSAGIASTLELSK